MPIRRNLHNLTRFDLGHRLHPTTRLFLDISLYPTVLAIGRKIRLQIMMHETMIIDNAEFFK